jgi:hypothetical protein
MSWTEINRLKRCKCKICGRRTVCEDHLCKHCSNWIVWETYYAEDDDDEDEDDEDDEDDEIWQ